MIYCPRAAEATLSRLKSGFPIIGITGPRQSGKTTLARHFFADKPYISLEDPDEFEFANSDARGFLNRFPNGAILDECQRVPTIFSYLQGIVDKAQVMGQFILTGSQQFGLIDQINQSLAGRIGLLTLLPYSLTELPDPPQASELYSLLHRGFFPPLYSRSVAARDWFASYVQTYVERDVRQLINVKDLRIFQTFLRMCASRVGQLVNLTSIGSDCGVSHGTVKEWISVLEASYIAFLLKPHFENFSKRLIKSPKLYFYDTGLLCYLLNIRTPDDIIAHPFRGHIFENFIVTEFHKASYSLGEMPDYYFWRDSAGTEIDLLFEMQSKLIPIEIKSSQTVAPDFFNGLQTWQSYAGKKSGQPILIYGGDGRQVRHDVRIFGWSHYAEFLPVNWRPR